MTRSERRQLESALRKLMKRDGDACTLCRAPFGHNTTTFYGRAVSGSAAIVGDCCRSRLQVEFGAGLYTTRDYDNFPPSPRSQRATPLPPDQLTAAVEALQEGIAGIDRMADAALQHAGLPIGARGQVSLKASPWKADDAAWFQLNPDRSHRLRPLILGERESFPPGAVPASLPDRHELQIVVRQVEPGKRIRVPFGRNLDVPIPDLEAVLHALFDLISGRREGSPVISVAEVAALAQRHVTPRYPS